MTPSTISRSQNPKLHDSPKGYQESSVPYGVRRQRGNKPRAILTVSRYRSEARTSSITGTSSNCSLSSSLSTTPSRGESLKGGSLFGGVSDVRDRLVGGSLASKSGAARLDISSYQVRQAKSLWVTPALEQHSHQPLLLLGLVKKGEEGGYSVIS